MNHTQSAKLPRNNNAAGISYFRVIEQLKSKVIFSLLILGLIKVYTAVPL